MATPLRDRIFGPTQREIEQEAELEAVKITLTKIHNAMEDREIDDAEGGYATVGEGLKAIDAMLDTKGWSQILGSSDEGGLSLAQVKSASAQLRELVVGNPFVQNGARIRTAAVWGGGVEYSAQNRTNGKRRNLPAAIQVIIEHPRNLRAFFANDAHEENERCAFTDGNIFLLGNDVTKECIRVPIANITADYRNPDDPSEIIAYRRSWKRGSQTVHRWYYTDTIPVAQRQATIEFQGHQETVERSYTMLDKKFNGQVGWAYGAPDGLAIVAWSRLYREFLTNGYIMSRALARIAYKVTVSSAKGAANATDVTLPGQSGSTAIEGQGNNLQPLLTAGRGYDFASGSPLAAAMAAGLGVSLLALTANPSAASGSNAAAQTLGPVEKATATMRRLSWDDYTVRLFRWMGLSQKLISTWTDINDDDVHRIMQALTLLDGLEVMGPEVIQHVSAVLLNIANPGEIPAGWKPKSQRKSGSSDGGTTGIGGATSGTGQGDDDGAGQSGNDHGED